MDEDSGDNFNLELFFKYVEFVFPRNTFAPILMALALENITSNALEWYFTEVGSVVGWTLILVISFLVSLIWGMLAGDRKILEEEVDDAR